MNNDLISFNLDEHGIATLSWDMPERSQNVLNETSCELLCSLIERSVSDQSVKAILMCSAKTDFIAGADLAWLASTRDAATLYARVMRLNRALRKLETCGKAVAMALSGTSLGGGLEIALCGHYRVAADNPKARFGFPEVTLGLLPGGGGTQRLPRLIGVQKSLPLLLEGKRVNVGEALRSGIVNAAVAPGLEVEAARSWLLSAMSLSELRQQPWDSKGYKIPGGAINTPAVQQILMAGNALVHAKTRGNYPAPRDILSCVYEGLSADIDTGLATEARYFVRLALSPQSKNMIRSLFFSMGEANKLASRPADVPVQKYARIGVLGAGMMGAGIAYVAAKAGVQVQLIDMTREAADKGKAYSEKLLASQVERGTIGADKAQEILGRISPGCEFDVLADSELVIEAVFEDRAIKADVTQRAEAVIGADALFASNTSTLPIGGLAEASVRPANFIGLHFFSPVDKMKLVEVIVGKQTSPSTLARSLDFVKTLGMTPIVVNDARGFYTSRVFSTYVLEGLTMLSEGVAPALIENAGLMAGMPVGPLALTDEVSSELITKIDHQTRLDLGKDYVHHPGHAVAANMVALGRFGKKSGKGFYDYPAEKNAGKNLWDGLIALYPRSASQPDVQQLITRMMTVQALETVRCMEQGVLTTARDADIGALLGWGFPAWTGGPLSLIDTIGLPRFIAQSAELHSQFGDRFSAPQLLLNMAQQGNRFYPEQA